MSGCGVLGGCVQGVAALVPMVPAVQETQPFASARNTIWTQCTSKEQDKEGRRSVFLECLLQLLRLILANEVVRIHPQPQRLQSKHQQAVAEKETVTACQATSSRGEVENLVLGFKAARMARSKAVIWQEEGSHVYSSLKKLMKQHTETTAKLSLKTKLSAVTSCWRRKSR